MAWLSTAIHHFDDLPTAVAERWRVLPGGVVLIRGFFAESQLFPWFGYFSGSERSVASFPSFGEVTEIFAARGLTHDAHVTVTEQFARNLHEWYEKVKHSHHGDSMLSPLADDEFSAGLAVIQERLALDDDEGRTELCPGSRLELLVFRLPEQRALPDLPCSRQSS